MKKIIFIILTAIVAMNVQAQTPRTSYFMDKYYNRHQRNPALSPARGYVNIPVVGNFYVGLESNLKLADFLYPVNTENGKKLGTFMHEDVSSKEFLKKIGRGGEMLNFDANINLLGFGFYTKKNRFWSGELNVRANGGLNIPKDFFAFFKEMDLSDGHEYNWKNLNGSARAYVEVAVGHSRDINENIRVGAKLKFLSGAGDARFQVNDMSLYTSREAWRFRADADVSVLGGMVNFKDSAGIVKDFEIADFEVANVLNFGGALDLGVSYKLDDLLGTLIPILPLKGFTASFGITDLGFISYKKSSQAKFEKSIEYTGVRLEYDNDNEDGNNDNNNNNNNTTESGNTIKADIDYLIDQFEDIMDNMRTVGDGGTVSRGLRTTTNVGLEYSFLKDKMSAGLLWSTHFGLPKVYNEMTISYNLRPVRWFSLSLSSSFAHGFFRTAGWAMNFTPKYGLDLFIGMDYVPFAWTPPIGDNWPLPFGLPIHDLNVNVNFGVSVPLGGNRSAKYDGTKRERRFAKYGDANRRERRQIRRGNAEVPQPEPKPISGEAETPQEVIDSF
ncbi:MAG: DUF5723 family protein [Bacteroidales bacterium]|jgi:hypothetical protein|nr:DUF5723 family protein [Bacteroidales bacterium]